MLSDISYYILSKNSDSDPQNSSHGALWFTTIS